MSRPELKAQAMHARGQSVYVYGIVRSPAGAEGTEVPPGEGLVGKPLRVITRDGVAAIVSALPEPIEGVPLDEALKDPEQARRAILDHHHVLRRTIDDRTVLPMRFGALFRDDKSVADALDKNRLGLLEALDRVEGAREWGVKIYCDRTVLGRHLGELSAAMRMMQGELAETSEGRAFFLRRRMERLAEQEAQRAIDRHVEASRLRLRSTARADAAMRIQPAAVHGCRDEMVWNGAFLVPRADEQRFLSEVDALEQAQASIGLRHQVTGPWPPFAFADCRLGG